MRRIVLFTLGGLILLVVCLLVLVGLRAEKLPAPDPAMPIRLSDGSSLPLERVVALARAGLPLRSPGAVEPLAPAAPAAPADFDAVYELAEQSRAAGRLDEALALYLSIPHGDPNYARARRIAAWNILARDQHKPEWAVRYANQALHAAPLDGNAWQDWWRVYASTLGLPVR